MAQSAESSTPADVGAFGKIAVQLRFVTQAQLEEALKVQASAAKAGLPKRLGDILVKKGYLSEEQVQQILKGQAAKKRIGDYELLSKLGEGGMGAVFKARQIYADRLVALKILSPKIAKNKQFQDRFVREARAVAKLNHPHIVAGIAVGSEGGYCYFAMEFVDGESLGQYMHRKGGKLEESLALEFTRQVALALQHAHENGLLHRDVKPDNVLLDKALTHAKLADLGLARSSESAADDAALTQAGQAVGTPFYISPEKARGQTNLTAATDLYSLGATLFHLLVGRPPYEGQTAAVIMTKHLTDPVASPRDANSSVSAAADKICRKLMQKEPKDRYASAEAVVADIERVQAGGAEVKSAPKSNKSAKSHARAEKETHDDEETPAGSITSFPRSVRRRRQGKQDVAGMGVALVLMAIAGVLIFVLQPWKAKPLRPTANPTRPTPPPPPIAPQYETPPPAVAASLTVEAEGGRSYRTDFEDRKAPNFEANPLLARAGQSIAVITDGSGKNQVLKLAQVRNAEASCMVRLVLPKELRLSKKAVFTFSANFGPNATSPDSEIRVSWDHFEGNRRIISEWIIQDSLLRTSWVRKNIALGKPAQHRLPSREPPTAPQYLTIYAGKPDENVDVFIDDVELTDGPVEEAAEAPAVAPAVKLKQDPTAVQPATGDPVPPPATKPPSNSGAEAIRNAL